MVAAAPAPPADAAGPGPVLFLGDSVMLGARAAVAELMGDRPHVFDAEVNRPARAGAELVRAHRAVPGAVGEVAVVMLGHNDATDPALDRSVAAIHDALADVDHVVWLTLHEVRDGFAAVNEVVRAAVADRPGALVADWDAVVSGRTGWTARDGLHLTPAGARGMAELVGAALDQVGPDLRGTPAGPDAADLSAAVSCPTPTVAPPAPAPPAPTSPARTSPATGAWLLDDAGSVHALGGAPDLGPAPLAPDVRAVDLAATPSGRGYWVLDSTGVVHAVGDAPALGGPEAAIGAGRPVALAGAPARSGYLVVTDTGGVFAYGLPFAGVPDPPFRVVAATVAPAGRPYWLLADDGRVARFDASGRPGASLATPAPGVLRAAPAQLAASPRGGLWIADRRGAVLGTGTLRHGSLADAAPCPTPELVDMAASPDGGGYWMAAADGRTWAFGDAPALGDVALGPGRSAVALEARPAGRP